MKEIYCMRCNEKMRFIAKEKIQLGKTGWILGDLPNLVAGALKVDIYICPACQKLEFYAADTDKFDRESSLPQKTCSVCGAVYDFDYPKCPKCKSEN